MGIFLLRYKKWLALLLIAAACGGAYGAWHLSQKAGETVLLQVNGQMEELLAAKPADTAAPSPGNVRSPRSSSPPVNQRPISGGTPVEVQVQEAPAATPASSLSAVAERKDLSGKINLNTATPKMLKDLPGIGDSKANAIIAYRERSGGFKNVDELLKVKGIGPKIFAQIKDRITV
jgi:competence protein ComEA